MRGEHDLETDSRACAGEIGSPDQVGPGIHPATRRLAVIVAGTRVSQPCSFDAAVSFAHPAYPHGYPHGTNIVDGDRVLATFEVSHVTPSGRRLGHWMLTSAAVPAAPAASRRRTGT